jgi:hypothetical protein
MAPAALGIVGAQGPSRREERRQRRNVAGISVARTTNTPLEEKQRWR